MQQFLNRELVGTKVLYQVVLNSWLEESGPPDSAVSKAQEELLKAKSNGSGNAEEIQWLSLKLQFLMLKPGERKSLIEEANAKELIQRARQEAKLQKSDAEEAIESHQEKSQELKNEIDHEREVRKKSLLLVRQDLEQKFSDLAKVRKNLG
ncbi:MAG: hypothetical protein KDD48_08070, partial [Bdellovibrionales bacterium]|nr:hypothetical protein [Bdellovibrionales bacterium]